MLYFAYGSNLKRERLLELCPGAAPLRTAKLADHAICFTGRSRTWGGGTATIGLAPLCDLWGALYEIDDRGRERVEAEGEPDGYVWSFTPVTDANGQLVHAGLLIKVRDLERNSPSDAYLELVKAGWTEWGIDPESQLRQMPSKL